MDSVKKAFYFIVDKNCGETAIKTFLDLHIQGGRPISKQADTVRQQIGDIIPKTFTIKTSHACSCAQCNCGGTKADIVVPAEQIKDLLTIFIILARQPRDVNPGYQGKIRELLKPFLESTSEFCMKTFVDMIEAYEDSKNLFVDKVKPQAKASLGKGNPGNNGQRHDQLPTHKLFRN